MPSGRFSRNRTGRSHARFLVTPEPLFATRKRAGTACPVRLTDKFKALLENRMALFVRNENASFHHFNKTEQTITFLMVYLKNKSG